jgi:hypothetical protein
VDSVPGYIGIMLYKQPDSIIQIPLWNRTNSMFDHFFTLISFIWGYFNIFFLPVIHVLTGSFVCAPAQLDQMEPVLNSNIIWTR